MILTALIFVSCGTPEGSGGSKQVQRKVSRLDASTKVAFSCYQQGLCSSSFVLSINSSGEFPKYCTGYMADSRNMVVPSECVSSATCVDLAAKTIDGKVHKLTLILEAKK